MVNPLSRWPAAARIRGRVARSPFTSIFLHGELLLLYPRPRGAPGPRLGWPRVRSGLRAGAGE